jgi:PAS domain S-box-containing protein
MSIPLRVLLVEDSEEDAVTMLRWLKRSGYTATSQRVDTAEGMIAALDREAWDIVLSDHDMPRFSSSAALRLLRQRGGEPPFVIVSGSISEELVVTAIKAGASDYVSKDGLSRLGPAVERALLEVVERREHRRAEEALQKSEERFALAVRGSQDGLWDWDFKSGEIYLSPRFKELLGFDAHELAGIDALVAQVHEDDRARCQTALRAHVKEQVPCDLEARIFTKQGEQRWFRIRGQALWDARGWATRMAGSLSDLTASKHAEAELKEQLEIIHAQKEAIRVLSLPIIEVWDGVLTIPVLGALDRERAAAMMEALLAAVTQSRGRHVILDLTGVLAIDADTAEHLIRIIRAVELLGAQGIVVGIQPQVANAIVAIGVDLSSITTLRNLRQALVGCMREVGHRGPR